MIPLSYWMAQNTTEQMKMFLTDEPGSRISRRHYSDGLPKGRKSSLVEAIRTQGNKGLKFVYLTHKDVVRHELVMRIIDLWPL